MSKTLQRNLKKKIPNGSEWDSSDDEDDAPVVVSKKQTKVKTGKSSKGKKVVKYDAGNQNDEGDNDEEKNLVLYIGHLPKDFEEIDLRRFLTQFGKVYNCRMARKVETGKPKGYAFVRFGDDETAKIVCETLHGYFLEKQRLICQLRPSHPGMFFDTDANMEKRKKSKELEAKQRNRNLGNSEKLKAITSRLVSREMKKRERLAALGIDYDFPGYKSNQADFEEEFIPVEETKADEEENDGSAKKKRRKESMDSTKSMESTNSEGSATKEKKKKKKKRKDSIDSIASDNSSSKKSKKEKKKKSKK